MLWLATLTPAVPPATTGNATLEPKPSSAASNAQYFTPSETATRAVASSFWDLTLTDLVQVAFWVTVAVVTVLTYRQARRTVLQPLRTEVFKLQLESMTNLLKLLVGKSEHDFRDYFGIDKAIAANTILLLDEYATNALGANIPEKALEERPYTLKHCPSAIMILPADEMVELAGLVRSEEKDNKPPVPPPWVERTINTLRLPTEYSDAVDELKGYLADPLMPRECAQLVQKFLDVAKNNVTCLLPILNKTSRNLPAYFPDIESLSRADIAGVSNEWNREASRLEPHAQEIIDFARSFFASDELHLGQTSRSTASHG